MSRRAWAAAAVAAAVASAAGAARAEAGSSPVAPARRCAEMAGLTLPGSTLRVTRAEAVPAAAPGTVRPSQFGPPIPVAVPAYCKLEGVIDPRTGADGKPYAIGFALALPDAWNGRFLFQGGGGLNGTVNPPFGAQAAGDRPALARGFAVVSTDSGHQGAVFDAAFMADQEAYLNFAQGSVGKTTAAAKALIGAYYGQGPRRSYFDGCSTGGREGMLVTERYPDEFDGVISGDPAMETGYSNLGLAWAQAAFNRFAPKDAAGKPDPQKLFSPADKQLVVKALLDACDGLDGLKDGLIFNHAACRFDPAALTCKGAKTDACLTSDQAQAVKLALAGPRTRGGIQVYPAFPYDAGIAGAGQGIPGILQNLAAGPVGGAGQATEIDVDQAAADLARDGGQQLVDTAFWTNLGGFFGRGGKVLYYHGMSDPWFSPLATLGYYQSLATANGGADKVRASARLFLVPGMGHCAGGPATVDQFDLLTALVDWVEDGKAPDQVVATGASLPGISRPLCAWPAHARYKGSGDPNDATSFACAR
jgi:feruloyl esterase